MKKKKKRLSYKDLNFKNLKKFWKWMWNDDSFLSYVVFLIFIVVFFKFIFFPTLSFLLNTEYPIVAIVSGSMEHKIVNNKICDKHILEYKENYLNLSNYWKLCGDYYKKNYNISKDLFSKFPYKNGLNIGDVIILYGKDPKKINVGDVIVFKPQNEVFFREKGPVIHRVVNKWVETKDGKNITYFRTKGDHNGVSMENFEDKISEDNIFGVALIRIPYIGLIKVYAFYLLSSIF